MIPNIEEQPGNLYFMALVEVNSGFLLKSQIAKCEPYLRVAHVYKILIGHSGKHNAAGNNCEGALAGLAQKLECWPVD